MNTEDLYTIFKQHPLVFTDTRNVMEGAIFFALKGANFDGNAFAGEAITRGAAFAVIDNEKYKINEQCLLVDNVLSSLQQLANYHRRQLNCPVLAITGSNGKTTTKELVSRVLSTQFRTHTTRGNLNNHIGVPLTILSALPDCQMLVVEMGANHQKEIAMLSGIAMPDYGLINNVGKAHLEGFGGFEGVKKGKGELYEFLAAHHGSAFINGDNPHLMEMARSRNVKRRILYGNDPSFDCSGKITAVFPFLQVEWKTSLQSGKINSKLIGEYNFENILAAVCIGNFFGVKSENICSAVENYIPDNSRSQVIERGRNTIILDAYNANPASMEAALKNFSLMHGNHKIVCLGEMAELGKESENEHRHVLDLLRGYNFEKAILVGKNFSIQDRTFSAEYFPTAGDACAWLKKQKIEGATILIKGSRSSKMETVLDAF